MAVAIKKMLFPAKLMCTKVLTTRQEFASEFVDHVGPVTCEGLGADQQSHCHDQESGVDPPLVGRLFP